MTQSTKMKAVLWTNYGAPDVLHLGEVDKPVPKENEMLVKIYAVAATMSDCEMRALKLPAAIRYPMRMFVGWKKPKRINILGSDLAGEIEAIGAEVTQYKPGDQIFAVMGFKFGGYAQYVCIPEKVEDIVVAKKPTNMNYEEAAAIPLGALNALHFLRQGNIHPGQKVLVNGAGGSIGTFGVQLAKYYGAEVTAVDSTPKLEMLTSIGADHVIDYTQEDFSAQNEIYDVVFDIVGKKSFSPCLRVVKKGGILLCGNPSLSLSLIGPFKSLLTSKKIIGGTASYRSKDMQFLKDLIEAGKIQSVVDKTYPLKEIIEAHRYVESGQKCGNVILSVEH